MVVIALEKCPLSLRGDLTKWLLEVSLGVYVGRVSARVRDKLWQRVCEESKSGRATMVYSAQNEQRMRFRVHNASWEPLDFDGVVLMLHPKAENALDEHESHVTHSNASLYQKIAKVRQGKSAKEPDEYVVVDIETTGLDYEVDEIVEIAAMQFELGEMVGEFHSFVRIHGSIPESVQRITGLNELDLSEGRSLEEVLDEFLGFIVDYPLVIHNAEFDLSFLDHALEQCGFEEIENDIIDTLLMARRKLPHMSSHRLEDLGGYFGVTSQKSHRALNDCITAREVFVRLLDM